MKDYSVSTPETFVSSNILKKYGIYQKIRSFLEMILQHNEKVNLVSRETSLAGLKSIAADCLIPFEYIRQPAGRIFDIGPGAGFPSIVIQTAFPNLVGILIERTRKKADFLARATKRLELDIQIIHKDFVEAFNSNNHAEIFQVDYFDFGFAKLIKPGKKLLLKAIDLLKPGGKFIYYGPMENIQFDIPDFLNICRYNYYLDDNKQLRSLSIFLKGDKDFC